MSIRFVFLTFLCSYACFSQDILVSGRVMDAQNAAIDFANVILLNTTDNTVLKGTTTNAEGYFILEHIEAGAYQLNISFIGYTTFEKTLELDASVDLNTLILQETTESLDAVNIVVQQPTFKKQSDRLVFNIENTSLTEGSVMDVLKSTPGILIMNDEISVKNSSNIIYLINDKRVYLKGEDLMQLLSGTNANYVQAVEVITNPPAKYDAEGAAVINIKMSKNLVTGYNGSVYANYTQGIYPRFNAGISNFYKTDKIDLFASYSYGEAKINRYSTSAVNFIEDYTIIGQWNGESDRNTKSKTHNINANLDYTINDANVISFSANVNVTPYWKRQANMKTEAVDSSFVTINDTDDTTNNIAANIDYVNTSQSGNTLSINLHHTTYDYDRYQDINSTYFNINNQLTRENNFHSTGIQNTYIFSGQADYSMNLKQDIPLEFGVKVSVINSESGIDQFFLLGRSFFMDYGNSGIFDYNESNYAGYVNASKSWESWQVSAGLRGEYTNGDGDIQGTIENNTFEYFKLFPTVNISHDFNENNSLGLSYGKRIERPTYSDLNPFKYYFNDYTYLQGNPYLQPTISHLTTLSYTLKSTYTFELYYRYQSDPTSELVFQNNNSNQLVYIPTNLEKSVDYGFDFTMYKPFTDFWSVYLVNSIFHETAYFKAIQSEGLTESNETWALYTNFMNFFTFLEDRSLSAEISLLYISPMINGTADISSRTQVDLGVKKSFNNGKWVASLKASDIFNSTSLTVKNKYLNQDNSYSSRFDNQWFRLGLRYNFGNTKLSTNEKEAKELNERNRLNSESSNN